MLDGKSSLSTHFREKKKKKKDTANKQIPLPHPTQFLHIKNHHIISTEKALFSYMKTSPSKRHNDVSKKFLLSIHLKGKHLFQDFTLYQDVQQGAAVKIVHKRHKNGTTSEEMVCTIPPHPHPQLTVGLLTNNHS